MKRFVEPAAGATGIPAWWEPLRAATSNHSVFLSGAWLQTWLEVYGAHFRAEWVRWEDSGAVVAGTLLVHRTVRNRGLPLRTAFFNASGEAPSRTPFAEFNDVVCLPGREAEVADDLASFLCAGDWDCLRLSGYEAGGILSHLRSRLPSSMVRAQVSPAAYVELGAMREPGALDAALSSNTRSQIRRTRRLYEERSGAVVLEAAATVEQALDYLERLIPLHNERWTTKGTEGSFASAEVAAFHRQLIPRLWREDAVTMLRARAGDRDIGYLYNVLWQGKVATFQSGFAYEADSRFKPGLLTHYLAIGHFAAAGAREYDFLAGDSRYKRSLAKSQRDLHWATLYRDRAWLCVAAWVVRMRDGLKSTPAPRAAPGAPAEPD